MRSLLFVMFAALALAGCDASGMPGASPFDPGALANGNTPSPHDAMAKAQNNFRERNFGLAEQQYRKLVEDQPKNADAWLGLGSVHDELGRFDLADLDYAQVKKLSGTTPELLNDRGYSYMLRGDFARSRRLFLRARAMDPTNTFIVNNLHILAEREAQKRPSKS